MQGVDKTAFVSTFRRGSERGPRQSKYGGLGMGELREFPAGYKGPVTRPPLNQGPKGLRPSKLQGRTMVSRVPK